MAKAALTIRPGARTRASVTCVARARVMARVRAGVRARTHL